MLQFTISGRVRGKERPRARVMESKSGKHFAHIYTPQKTAKLERTVGQIAAQEMRGRSLLLGPLVLTVTVFQQPAVSWSKKRKRETKWITGKPDCDNQIKLLADAMQGIVFKDDSQIAKIDFERRYDVIEGERVLVTVSEAT